MNNAMIVDLEKLKAISTENQSSKSVFKYLFERRRGRQDTNIKRVQRLLKESGEPVNSNEISDVFRKLQELGIGKIVFGRRGNPNRFMWTANLLSIKELLEGKSQQLYKQNPTAKKLNQPKLTSSIEAPPVVAQEPEKKVVEPKRLRQTFIVRKGEIEIEVPAVITDEEAKSIVALLSAASK